MAGAAPTVRRFEVVVNDGHNRRKRYPRRGEKGPFAC
jgi:hypothetical protein